MKALNDLAKFTDPKCFKKLRCNEEQGAVGKHAREGSNLRDQAGFGLERSYSCMSVLDFKSAICVSSLFLSFLKSILISITCCIIRP